MYATAHRVRRDGESAINAFLYLHGPRFKWPHDVAAIPETQPGTLMRKTIAIPPGQNIVMSFLDVIAPDGTARTQIDEALSFFRRDIGERRNPTTFSWGLITLRFGVQLRLEGEREQELDALLPEIARVLPEA
jgi:hypothetical protein